MRVSFAIGIVCALAFVAGVYADDDSHTYEDGEEVVAWMNKVGPYHNPQETYAYYSLPFCHPQRIRSDQHKRKSENLGSVLEGNELSDSGYLIRFRKTEKRYKICTLKIDEAAATKFNEAVANSYWYQMYIDDLPIWGMVGEMLTAERDDKKSGDKETLEQGFIYTHKDFSIAYNGNQIIEVNLTSEDPRAIVAGETHEMTYSVTWTATDGSYEHRFDRYLDMEFFEHQIHWFSIFNSFMMVVFLCGLVALILMRTLKADFARFTNDDSDDLDLEHVVDESGWKHVHGDVFRPPPYLTLYSALIGTGHQLFALGFFLIAGTLIGTMFDHHYLHRRGLIMTSIVVLYCLTSALAGYISASYYKRCGGEDWKQTMVMTAALFPGVAYGMAMSLNFIAIYYSSLIALPFFTMVTMLFIWLLVSCPLVLVGTVIGRARAQKGDFPCRVNSLRRPIPDGPWYTRPVVMILFGGILPFGSIFIEMYFIFTSFFNYKFYYVFGFMLLVYLILVIVTVCVTIVSTYFLLNAEDYRWQWMSFLAGGSTALYVYTYAIYYFSFKTRMSGALQTAYYFGYMFVFCFGLFILCGTLGYIGTNIFIRKIYSMVKAS